MQTALRYCGVRDPEDPLWKSRMEELADSIDEYICFHYTYRIYPISFQDGQPYIRQKKPKRLPLEGELARTLLSECTKVVVIGATLGLAFDRQLRILEKQNPAKAICFDALGSALIDRKLDDLQDSILAYLNDLEGWDASSPLCFFTDRFSCGYGDLPLSLQKDFERMLDLQKTTGIHVLDSGMMSPTKSVTALIGISDYPQPARIRGCAHCNLSSSCPYRKGGTVCHV